jgi:predicted kinase
VPTLVHLNGPPGIGKSTLAALWAERHPGTLNLDVDRLHALVGGWRDPENRTHDVLRPVALAMASAHLAGGRDVVLPQYLGRVDEVEAFADVAHGQGAEFREVVLLDDRASALERFARRDDHSEWDRHNRVVVADLGGAAFLGALHDQLLELLRRRPSAVVVQSRTGAVEETYAALVGALVPGSGQRPDQA